jgi:DNA-binding transcriptional LysR family regulator
VIQSVLDGSASLGISVISREYPEIDAHPLLEESISLYCGPGHPLYEAADAQVTLERLATFDCVDLPSRHHVLGHEVLERLQMRVQASTPETQRLLISTGQFIGFLPQTYASSTLSTKKLRALSPETLSFKCVIVEFVLRDVPKSLACEHFETALRTVFGKMCGS